MTGGDHTTPIPRLTGPRVRLLSVKGLAYYGTRTAWRYLVTGREIIGPGDNATFLHDATVDYRGRPYVTLSRARWRRVARRWALVGIPGSLLSAEGTSRAVATPYEWLGTAPPGWTDVPWVEMLQGYAIVGPVGLGVVAYPRVREWYATREIRREAIYPATRVACQILGQRWDRRRALTMLDLPPGFGSPDEDGEQQAVRLYLPPVPLDKGIKARIVSNVGSRLGLPDATGEWHERGGQAWVELSGADTPPKRVDLSVVVQVSDDETDSLRNAIMSAPPNRPVVGVASGVRLIRADMDNESPHVGSSGGTGTGKSTLYRCFLIPRQRAGYGALILDLKGISHRWVWRVGPTRAMCAYRIEEIHDAAVALGDELYRRRDEAVRAAQSGLPDPEFRPLDVLVEEANSLIAALRAYWTARRREILAENKAAREDDPYAEVTEPPVASPAVTALAFGVQMGRELRIHMHYAGQRLSATVFGGNGADVRASIKIRLLAKYDRAAWRMLVDDVPFQVCPSGPRGLWTVVQGGQVTHVRVPFLSDDQAVDMIMDSPDPGQPVLPGVRLSGQSIPGQRRGQVVDSEVVQAVQDRLVTLSDAADALSGVTLEALRVASKRDANFPEPAEQGGPGRAHLYSLAALTDWHRARREVGRGGGSRGR